MDSKPKTVTKPARATESKKRAADPAATPNGRKRAAKLTGSKADTAVAEFLRDLDHPLKAEVEALRKIILGVDPGIGEGIKWNAPSFHTTEHFATFNLRTKDRVRLILHTGAKKCSKSAAVKIADPEGLLEWLAEDRCLVTFQNEKEVRAKRKALEAIIRQWMERVA